MQTLLGGSQSSNICYSAFDTKKTISCFGQDRCCCYDDSYHGYPTCCSCSTYSWLWLIVIIVIAATLASLINMLVKRKRRLNIKPHQQPTLQTVIKNLQAKCQQQRKVQQLQQQKQQRQRLQRERQYQQYRQYEQHKQHLIQQRLQHQQKYSNQPNKLYVPPPIVQNPNDNNKTDKIRPQGDNKNNNGSQHNLMREQTKMVRQQEKKEVKSYQPNPNDPEYQRLQQRDALFNEFLQRRSVNSQQKKQTK